MLLYMFAWEAHPELCGLSLGLKVGDRTESQADWMANKVPVIVATISFGMGVDKANVR